MKDPIPKDNGDAATCGKSQSEYLKKLEAKIIEQANEILLLKRKLNRFGGLG